MNKPITLAAAAAALAAASCSDRASEGDPGIAEAAAEGEAEPVAAAGAEMRAELTIAENAAAARELTTLVRLAAAAGLAETLAGPGPYTLFAPTDGAFAALPEGAVDRLAEEGAPLVGLISYHLVPGVVTADDLRNAIRARRGPVQLATMAGVPLTVRAADQGFTITDGAGKSARIVQADAIQSNGMIHVVDGVLRPGEASAEQQSD